MRQKGRYRSPLEDNVLKPQVKVHTKKPKSFYSDVQLYEYEVKK